MQAARRLLFVCEALDRPYQPVAGRLHLADSLRRGCVHAHGVITLFAFVR